jgi:hypothetical protein
MPVRHRRHSSPNYQAQQDDRLHVDQAEKDQGHEGRGVDLDQLRVARSAATAAGMTPKTPPAFADSAVLPSRRRPVAP